MDRITQEAYQRQRILKWAEKKKCNSGGDTVQGQPQDGIQVEKAV